MDSYVKDNNQGGETTKGLKKIVLKKNIKHDDCKNVLSNSKSHQLGSYELYKVSLSCFDDKRYIHGINSLCLEAF